MSTKDFQVQSGSTKNIAVSRANKFAAKNASHTSNHSVGTIKINVNPNFEYTAIQIKPVIPPQPLKNKINRIQPNDLLRSYNTQIVDKQANVAEQRP